MAELMVLCAYVLRHHLLAEDVWKCALSEKHEGEHYLIRADAAGRVSPVPPDAERDQRRAAYAKRERDRARRALDAWFRAVADGHAIDHPVRVAIYDELVQCMADYSEAALHHKGNYGVPACEAHGPHPHTGHGGCCLDCPECYPPQHNGDHGAPDAAHDERARQRDRERAVTDFRCTTHGRRGCAECCTPVHGERPSSGFAYPQSCDGKTLMPDDPSLFVCGRKEAYGRHDPHLYGLSEMK